MNRIRRCFKSLLSSRYILLLAVSVALPFAAPSEEASKPTGERSTFPCPENEIERYTAYRVSERIKIDGHLDEQTWTNAPWSPRFHDMLTGGPTIHETRACP